MYVNAARLAENHAHSQSDLVCDVQEFVQSLGMKL